MTPASPTVIALARRSTLQLAWIGALAAVLGCSETPPPLPRPLEVSPSQIVEGGSVRIAITGEGLTARTIADFSDPSQTRVETGYTARLGTVSLRQVRLEQPGVLSAVVPEGLAPGAYDLVVTDPWRRDGALPLALRVLSADAVNALVHGFRFEPIGPQRVFSPFRITLTAVDAEGNRVSAYNEAVALDDKTGTVVPKVAGFFAFGQWSAEVDIRAPSEADVLTVSDRFGKSGTSNAFTVASRPATSLRFKTAPRITQAGACSADVVLQLLDAQGGETLAVSPLPLALSASPSGGLSFFRDPACQEPLVNPSFSTPWSASHRPRRRLLGCRHRRGDRCLRQPSGRSRSHTAGAGLPPFL